jgi:hypothetical protein
MLASRPVPWPGAQPRMVAKWPGMQKSKLRRNAGAFFVAILAFVAVLGRAP